MHRFFLPPECIRQGMVVFPEEVSRQAARVLRLKPDEKVVILDNRGSAYTVSLIQVSDRQTTGKVIDQQPVDTEPRARVHLYPSMCQREKFEFILQKCTEVGVAAFTPLITSRSLVQKSGEPSKMDRWQKIIQEAAEQSGRGRIPELFSPISYSQGLTSASRHHPFNFILWEDEHTLLLSSAVSHLNLPMESVEMGLLIGPEGGYSEEEVTLARSAGITSVSLGKRILRTETAAIVGTALLLQCLGEMA